MGRRTWVKIYCDKWLRGTLREETLDLRGAWIDLLALAGDSAYGDIGKISLADKCGLTDKQICTILNIKNKKWQNIKKRLIETDRIKANGYNEIEIVNWDKYQSEYERQKPYREKLLPKVTTKSNKEIEIEIEKEKEIKIKKKTYAEFVKLTPQEYKNLFKYLYDEFRVREAIKKLDNYKGASGKKYKSDYRAILTWVVDEILEKYPIGPGYREFKDDRNPNDKLVSPEKWKELKGEIKKIGRKV